MKKTRIRLSITLYFFVGVLLLTTMLFWGFDYYSLSLSERFFHSKHKLLNPSGSIGHFFGITGSVLITAGVTLYIIRKRWRRVNRIGYLKYWLEFHIFLCSLGSLLILFHTAFKFGGIISIGFWALVIVVLSGIVGRLIYIQIPRTLQGEKISQIELENNLAGIMKDLDINLLNNLKSNENLMTIKKDSGFFTNLIIILKELNEKRRRFKRLKKFLSEHTKIEHNEKSILFKRIKQILSLQSKIALYSSFEILFKQWHIFHLPFAFVMFFLMLVHIIIVMIFKVN